VNARLVVSLSGINTRTMDRCVKLAGELDRREVPLSLLVAPRLCASGPVVDWVDKRRQAGDALVLHGFDHCAEPRMRTVALGRRAEFAALPAHEAGLRLTAALRALEHIGWHTACFAPPRWLASRGTLTALRRKGFALCADITGVRELSTGTAHRGRVHGFGDGVRSEPWWCYAMVLGAGRAARRGGLVRIAADASDLTREGPRQALLDAIDLALHHGARPATYPDLLSGTRAAAA